MKIYVITADADHECNTPIRAYASRDRAEAFMERVRRHVARRPECPTDTGDTAVAESWWELNEAWMSRHPAGREWAYYGSDFTIHTLAVIR
ncbi:hypothetical protein EAT51_04245 [Pseudoxanthomonas winnipegensis]|uniref:hypothetical protein n=1 Tax=Pseudoxanthomonas winnipegensis TaxID=2480810 RepID=UPI00102D7A74|nr:hypothetical protein [Pseudoxanthomonas winnipegensis]TAA42916.1 hypothetical protein EAT51_04245 [Pseudoxanthomonas winnipegensis]